MQTDTTSEPTGSRVPGVIPEPIRPRKSVFAKLVSALRGDKYMVGAYAPEWRGAARADDNEPSTARAAPADSSTTKGL